MPDYTIEKKQVNTFKNIIHCNLCNEGILVYSYNTSEQQLYYTCNNCNHSIEWNTTPVYEIEYEEIP